MGRVHCHGNVGQVRMVSTGMGGCGKDGMERSEVARFLSEHGTNTTATATAQADEWTLLQVVGEEGNEMKETAPILIKRTR
jgi:hypothetical protein